MRSIRLDRRWQVDLLHRSRLPLSAAAAWAELADFERYACLDYFHRSVELDGERPAAGVGIRIRHGLFGIGFDRVGRILRWRPGRGWAFSDLSARGAGVGFPHVYLLSVEPDGADACRLTARVTGRWTLRVLPRPLVRLWLTLVMTRIGVELDHALLRSAVAAPSRSFAIPPTRSPD